DMENYIRHRILVVGGSTTVSFERSAMEEIYNYSQGYPRLINLVCDRALLAGYNAQTDVIDASLVKLGIRSLLGEEEKKYFIKRFLKFRVPVIASILFFLAGVLFFFLSQENLNWKKGFEALTVAFQSPGTAPVARGIAPALSDASSSAPSRPKVETADAAPV
ncbi:MAG: hypothetical protein GWM98_17845, partial [Nitrospinaceae bacterium]|nr:hypothetical protein [Nitrospinaceae bacterium]NIR56012.1 hypothetical protein [Nitrospinaceae bacterium]NIS86456.1 hypothetical protein [Nitrospinaceae bacterium]NIT83291.1 hypothetical protein [Nitrospinaceae bacterium]NIU45501.1 hypothetical protein [Nitrospinaceae bacterium]